MSIAYVYYTNSMKSVTVYLWEPHTQTERYFLKPYATNKPNCWACKEVLLDFESQQLMIRKDGKTHTAPLREPTKEKRNLKHQAHFDFDVVDWEEVFS